jgi:hypothetical protein
MQNVSPARACYSSASGEIMSSPNAINRENAQLSTGPRTDEGKQKVRLNGLRHGLTGQTVVMPYEDRLEYDQLVARTIAELKPADDTERALVQTIADSTWRLERARAIEHNIFTLGFEAANPQNPTDTALAQAQTWVENAKELNLLSVYAGRISRTIDKARRELNELQAARSKARAAALEEAILIAQLAKSKGETFNPADLPNENGFGFSTREIEQIVNHRDRLAQAIAHAKSLKRAA